MKLTNRNIAEDYQDYTFHLMISDFKGAFAYWVAAQNPLDTVVVDKALIAYTRFLKSTLFTEGRDQVVTLNQDGLRQYVNEKIFVSLPDVLALNEMEPDFIDLAALARNVLYTICRLIITQPL